MMRIVVALGGNALLRRGQPLSAVNQRNNVRAAAHALAPLAQEHSLLITHGNGPQVGLLALQGDAYRADESYPLDVLDAETEGMIGYLIEQELTNALPDNCPCATLLTQIEVDPNDPAFKRPSKPIGPVYDMTQAQTLATQRGWRIAEDNGKFRRVVPSPRPLRLLELKIIELLVERRITVICAGGGGIPVVKRSDGSLIGVEAVIDKDHASSLLAREIKAEAFLMLTDVDAVYTDWGKPEARPVRRVSVQVLAEMSFAAGSMAPKVEAALDFVAKRKGIAGIGRLQDAKAILDGTAGTVITASDAPTLWWN